LFVIVVVFIERQTFNQCTAEIDAMVIAIIPDIPACLAALRQDYGVEASQSDHTDRVTLRGTLAQLTSAQDRLVAIHAQQCELQRTELNELELRSVRSVQQREVEQKSVASKACNTDTLIPAVVPSASACLERILQETRSAREVPIVSATSIVSEASKQIPSHAALEATSAGPRAGDVDMRHRSNVTVGRKKSNCDERFTSEYITTVPSKQQVSRTQQYVASKPIEKTTRLSAFQQPRHPARNLQEWVDMSVKANPQPPQISERSQEPQRTQAITLTSQDPQNFYQQTSHTSRDSQSVHFSQDSRNFSDHHNRSEVQNHPPVDPYRPPSVRNRPYSSGVTPTSGDHYAPGYDDLPVKNRREMQGLDDPKLVKTSREADRIMAELKQQRERAARSRSSYTSNKPFVDERNRSQMGGRGVPFNKHSYNDSYMDQDMHRAFGSLSLSSNEIGRRTYSGEEGKMNHRPMEVALPGDPTARYLNNQDISGSEFEPGRRWAPFDRESFADEGLVRHQSAVHAGTDRTYRKGPNSDFHQSEMYVESGVGPDPTRFDGRNGTVWQQPASNRWRFSGERNVSSNNPRDMSSAELDSLTLSASRRTEDLRDAQIGDDRQQFLGQCRNTESPVLDGDRTLANNFQRYDKLSQSSGPIGHDNWMQFTGPPIRQDEEAQSSGFFRHDKQPLSSGPFRQDIPTQSRGLFGRDQRPQSDGLNRRDQPPQSSGLMRGNLSQQRTDHERCVEQQHMSGHIREDESQVKYRNNNNNNETEVTRDYGGRGIGQNSSRFNRPGASNQMKSGEKTFARLGCDHHSSHVSQLQPVQAMDNYSVSGPRTMMSGCEPVSSPKEKRVARVRVVDSVMLKENFRHMDTLNGACWKEKENTSPCLSNLAILQQTEFDTFGGAQNRFSGRISAECLNQGDARDDAESMRHHSIKDSFDRRDDELCSINLDFFVVSYVMTVKVDWVSDICRRFDVKIRTAEQVADDVVSVRFEVCHPGGQDEEVLHGARVQFVKLYEDVFRRIVQQTVQVSYNRLCTLYINQT